MSFRKSSLLAVLTALALVVVALTAAANHVADNSLTVQSAIDAGNSNPPANPGKTHDQHGPFNHPQEGETPDISLSEETLDFGEASIVESVRLFLMISNIGDADLVVSDISTEAPFYPAFNGEFTVAPEEVHELVVTFTPEVVGEYEGVLMIVSNDPVEEETTISLLGTGVLPQDGLHYHWRLTDTNASILIRGASLLAEALPAGDEIAVFTPGGVCAGAGVWNGNQIGIAAFGDEDDTEIIEGFHSEERMSFRIWDWEAETEYRAIPHYIQGDGLFRVNGFTAIERLEGVNFYHWAAPERTDNNHSLLVEDATLDNEPLNIGDEIGLFTPTGMLAG